MRARGAREAEERRRGGEEERVRSVTMIDAEYQQQQKDQEGSTSDDAPSNASTGAFSGQRCTSTRTAGMLAAASLALDSARRRCCDSVEDQVVPGSADDAQDWRRGIPIGGA